MFILVRFHRGLHQSQVEQALDNAKVAFQVVEGTLEEIKNLYASDLSLDGIVCESTHPQFPPSLWLTIIDGLAKLIPVLVLGEENDPAHIQLYHPSIQSVLYQPSVDDVVNFAKSCVGQSHTALRPMNHQRIPLFNPMVAERMLRTNHYLSVLSVHLSNFRRISTDYGMRAFQALQSIIEKVLIRMWGESGAFRRTDILCRRSYHATTFYILLDRRRQDPDMPSPGDLEALSDRLSGILERLLLEELRATSLREIPKWGDMIPRFVVGYASVVLNPSVDLRSIIEDVLRHCRETSDIQEKRAIERQGELIQTLVQGSDFLVPHYQAVFDIRKISEKDIKNLRQGNALHETPHAIWGFEALVRLKKENIKKLLRPDFYHQIDFLDPLTLFAKANEVKLKLELDQACFRMAFDHFIDLPGYLLVNILPRNIYALDRLETCIPPDVHPIFEVSESEAINNVNLIQEILEKFRQKPFKVAIDDFGSGYASMERLIQLQPHLIKLDRALIQDIHKNAKLASFVRGIIDAVKGSESEILAEGVECVEELLMLKEMGIPYVQGFLMHKPELRGQIVKKLKNSSFR